jgi:hypothetical protein
MSEKIYGVDLDQEVTPLMVRDAIVKCFYKAHCADAQLAQAKEMGKPYCTEIVKKAFADSGGDFEKPSKKSIIECLEKLKEFAANFRNPSIIKKHYKEIMELVSRL